MTKSSIIPDLRILQARVLYALMPISGSENLPVLTRVQLAKRVGWSPTSGTINRALHGVRTGSSSGNPHKGLLDIGLIVAIDLNGITQYQITTEGLKAIEKHPGLPKLRNKAICINNRYLVGKGATEDVEGKDRTDDEIDQLIRTNRLRIGIVSTDSQEALVRQQRGQARIRALTVENYGGCCAVCDVTDPALLIASHVVAWADDPEHRGNLSNVICLCRIHDALFEAGYWSLGDDLALLRKKSVTSKVIRQLLGVMTWFRKPLKFPPAPCFVRRHRERVGFAV